MNINCIKIIYGNYRRKMDDDHDEHDEKVFLISINKHHDI